MTYKIYKNIIKNNKLFTNAILFHNIIRAQSDIIDNIKNIDFMLSSKKYRAVLLTPIAVP